MNATQPPALQLENVTRIHEDGLSTVTALDDVSLSVKAGELVAIMGPSGSGKSTLLNVAGTLDVPTSGEVFIEGQPTSSMTASQRAKLRRNHIGFVFQHFNLVATLTVAENISLPLELDGMNWREARDAALAVLQDLDLRQLADRYPSEVSGGQRQRVAIGRALVGSRRLILADEPTGALDTTTGESIMELIRNRVDEGAAALLVTHEPRFAAWADRTVYLRDGVLQ